MSSTVTKQEIRRFLNLSLDSENELVELYDELSKEIKNKETKDKLKNLYKEKKNHSKLVKEMLKIVD